MKYWTRFIRMLQELCCSNKNSEHDLTNYLGNVYNSFASPEQQKAVHLLSLIIFLLTF